MKFMEFIFEKFKIIGLALVIIFILHGISGKSRWQYYPIYIVAILYFILVLLNHFKILDLNPSTSKLILVGATTLIFISIILLLIFPMEKLPQPSGKFSIGTRTYELKDENRREIYKDAENEKRRIKYQIWYPADEIEEYEKIKWIDKGIVLTKQLARSMNLPDFILQHTAKIDSNSYYKAPMSNSLENYPVVIISHGWKGFREIHTDFAEELASNGFIVISIDHTYGSQMVEFEDGEIAYLNKNALPREDNPYKYNYNSRLLVTTYGEDVASVLDDLENLNNMDKNLKGKLDLEKVGLLGHSTGGGGDVYISLKDERIKALLGLDAWVHPIKSNISKSSLSTPSLFLSSEQWSTEPNYNVLNYLVNNSTNSILIQMNKTNHVDFSMVYMYSPLSKYIGFTGKLGGRYSSNLQREIILNFFNESLRSDSDYNEDYLKVIFDKYNHLEIITGD